MADDDNDNIGCDYKWRQLMRIMIILVMIAMVMMNAAADDFSCDYDNADKGY